MEKEIKAINAKIESKAANEDGSLHIKFYACVFGNIDSYGDIIAPTACNKFLASEDADRMRLCYQHDTDDVIGVITSKVADETGLLVEADVLPTRLGNDVITLLKAGAINEFSIGYRVDECHYDNDIRILDQITIAEVSPVTRAANPKAVLLEAKAEDFGKALSSMPDEEFEKAMAEMKEEETRRLIQKINI